jgi:signal recognition particle receptor subunit beta
LNGVDGENPNLAAQVVSESLKPVTPSALTKRHLIAAFPQQSLEVWISVRLWEARMDGTADARSGRADIFELLREEALRQVQLGVEIVALVLDSEGLFSEDPSYPGITRAWLEELRKTLEIEVEKLRANEATIAVIGTVKSGKSTVINAIVGSEVVPSRDQPMTTFPTRVVHIAGMAEPVLNFPLAKGFLALAKDIEKIDRARRKAGEEPMDGLESAPQAEELKQLLTEIREKRIAFASEARGQEAIQDLLVRVNDLTRLGALMQANLSLATPRHLSYDEVPTIQVEFEHLANAETKSDAKIALVDTPGPNEHGNNRHLVDIVARQLEEASGIILVVDYQGFGNTANRDVEEMLKVLVRGQADRLFVLMNKYDQRGVRGLSEEDVRGTVLNRMAEAWGTVPDALRDRIFPTSARYALRANQVRRTLRLEDSLDLERNEWAPEFLTRAFGEIWEDDPEVVRSKDRLLKAAALVWANSRFEAPLEIAVAESARNASMILVLSALAKLEERTTPLLEMFGIREGAFQRTVEELQRLIDDFRSDIRDLEGSMAEAGHMLAELRDLVGPQIIEEVSAIADELTGVVNTYLKTGVVPPRRPKPRRFKQAGESFKDLLRKFNPFSSYGEAADEEVQTDEAAPSSEEKQAAPVWYLVAHPVSREKVLKVSSRSEAMKTSNEIFDKVAELMDASLDALRDNLVAQMEELTGSTRGVVSEIFSRKWQQVDDRLREILGVTLKPPPLDLKVKIEFEPGQRAQGTYERERTVSGMRDVAGKEVSRFFGDLFSEFRSQPLNWGREYYSHEVTDHYVDVSKIKEQANRQLGALTERLRIAVEASLERLHERMLDYGRRVRLKVEAVNQILLEEMHQKSEQADVNSARRDQIARLALQARDLVGEAANLKKIAMERHGG